MHTIGVLVTGHGEVEAIPILIRRALHESLGVYDVGVGDVIRKPEQSVLHRSNGVLKNTALRLAKRNDAVLVVLDLEDDCPAQTGPALQARLDAAVPHKPGAVVCVYRELETWFIYDAENLFGVAALPNPESRRDAKKWLRNDAMCFGYNERADSPRLCGRLNRDHVRSVSDSFRVFEDRLERLVFAMYGD